MSTPLISPTSLGDLIKSEYDTNYTRESVSLRAGAAYPLGAVLGRISASGVYALSPAVAVAGQEGAEVACAVLLHAVPASNTATQALVLARGPAIVADRALAFDASVTSTADQTRKHQQLAAFGVVVRAVA